MVTFEIFMVLNTTGLSRQVAVAGVLPKRHAGSVRMRGPSKHFTLNQVTNVL